MEEGAPTAADDGKETAVREGKDLLGSPTFEQLDNGRFRCVETGHETPAHGMDSYAKSKRCRLGLVNFALSKQKPPLNMFKQDPLCRSKLICKLTGDNVNKSEEHIWKHINGRRFLNKLEQMEAGDLKMNGKSSKKESKNDVLENGVEEDEKKKKKDKKKMKKKKKEKQVEEAISEIREPVANDSDSEEAEFWMPPVGDRWDLDNGEDRWGSGSDSGDDDCGDDEGKDDVCEAEDSHVSEELSTRTKRMSIEIGPSSFASRKKKSKASSSS